MKTDCPFCELIAKGDVVEFDRYTVRFAPLNPVTPGHMLFVPNEHFATAADWPSRAGHAFAAASTWGMLHGEDFNLIQSNGRLATQTVKHVHVHYVPRYEGDGLALPWTVARG